MDEINLSGPNPNPQIVEATNGPLTSSSPPPSTVVVSEENNKVTSGLNENQKKEVDEKLQHSVNKFKLEIKKESEEIKKDFLTLLGLFISFITFISLEIQIFKNSENIIELVGVTSLSLSFIMFFALMLSDLAKSDIKPESLMKPKYLINVCFLILGLGFLVWGGCKEENRLERLEKELLIRKKENATLSGKILTLQRNVKILQSLANKKDEDSKANRK